MTQPIKKRSKLFTYLLLFLALGIGIAAVIGYEKYHWVFSPNVPDELKENYINIPSNTSFSDLVDILHKDNLLKDTASFVWLSNRMNFRRNKVRSGKYKIKPGWSNYDLIKHLRSGQQVTVKLVLSTGRLPEDVAKKAATFIEADSSDIAALIFNESYLKEKGFDYETIMSAFIPNTYEFYWNTNAKKFFDKMISEHDKFWNKDDRKLKAEAINMSPKEIYTLASIIERETNQNKEKKRMAGVYLNRLRRNIPLQADPTCVFATRDFSTKRVTNKHTQFDSPYNTYMYAGLPPGPISMASISSIDAVLNAEEHEYIYFCAKGDGTGYHNFARTNREHEKNAAIYRKNLRKRGKR